MTALGLALAGAIAITGCSATTTDEAPQAATTATSSPTQTPASTATSSPTTTPTTTPEALVVPECASMNAAAQQEYEEFGIEMFAEPAGEVDLSTFTEVGGPGAQAAMSQAQQQRGCRWPIHSQGTVTEYVAELPQVAKDAFISALRGDPSMTEMAFGGAVMFSYEVPAPNGYMSPTKVAYVFIEDVWISVFDYAGQRDYVQAALEGVLTANPALANTGTSTVATEACSERDGLAELAASTPTVPGGPWDTTGQFSDASGYDACATLSWIVLRPEPCCTRFSVTPVLFFHRGDYVPSATITSFAIDPSAAAIRESDDSVTLTFMWPGADSAGPANTAASTYTWDADTAGVHRSGELPPA